MSLDVADVDETLTTAFAISSRSSRRNDSNAVDSEIRPAQKRELASGAEASRKIDSPSWCFEEVNMPPIKTIVATSQKLSASAEVTADIASPSSTASTVSGETLRSGSQEPSASTRVTTGMDSRSSIIGRSNKESDQTIVSENQQNIESFEACRYIIPSLSKVDILNTVTSEMPNSQIEKLSSSNETITSLDHFNRDVEAAVMRLDFIDTSSLKGQKQLSLDEGTHGVGSYSWATEGQNMTSEVLERTSFPADELMALAEIVLSTDIPSSNINTSTMLPKLIKTYSAQAPELPFGPFSAEGTPEIESPSPDIADQTPGNMSEPVEPHVSDVHGQSTLGGLTPDTKQSAELTELSSTESLKLGSLADWEATEVSPNISLSSHLPSNMYSGDDALKCELTNLLKPNHSSKVSSEDTLEMPSGSLSPAPPIVTSNTPEAIIPKILKDPISETLSILSSPPSSISHVNKLSEVFETRLVEATHSPPSAGNNCGSNVDGTPLLSYEDGSATWDSVNTVIESPEKGVEVDMYSSMPDIFFNMQYGRTFANLGQTPRGDETISDQFEFDNHASWEPLSGMNRSIYSGADMDVAFQFDEEATTNFLNLELPAAASEEVESSIAGKLTTSGRFESISPEAENPPVPGATLKITSLSIVNIKEEINNDSRTMAEMYPLLPSVETGAEKPQPLNYHMPPSWAYEPVVTGSPEIKLEPISMEDIPQMDSPTLATTDQKTVPRLVEDLSPNIREGAPSPEASSELGTLVEAKSSTLKAEPTEMSSIDTQLLLVSIPKDSYSPRKGPEGTARCSRKRVRVDVEYVGEDQKRPAKKLHQQLVSGCNVAPEETVALVSEPIEMGSLNVHQMPSPTESSSDMTSRPSTSIHVHSATTEMSQFTARRGFSSAEVQPQFSESINNIDSETSLATRSTLVNTPQPKFRRSFANETIELRVGPTNKCVLAQKHILTKSPFFALLFSQNPRQRQLSQTYYFPRFDTYALATIVHWLHYDNIQYIAEDYKADEIFNTVHMIKVHLLCLKLQLRSLTNLTVELLGHGYLKNKSAPTIEEIDTAYSEIDQVSGLRIYMAAWTRCREHAPLQRFMMAGPWDQSRFKALCKKHPDLPKDMKLLDENSGSESPISLNPRFHKICWYHDHQQGEQCGVSGKTFENACSGTEPRLRKQT